MSLALALFAVHGDIKARREDKHMFVCPLKTTTSWISPHTSILYIAGVVTLTSTVQGAICPGEEVTLTCIVTGGVILEWNSVALNPTIRYAQNSMQGLVQNHGIFTAVLTSVSTNPTFHFDFNSSLRVTVTPEVMLNGTVITCTDTLNPISTTLTLAGTYFKLKLRNWYINWLSISYQIESLTYPYQGVWSIVHKCGNQSEQGCETGVL